MALCEAAVYTPAEQAYLKVDDATRLKSHDRFLFFSGSLLPRGSALSKGFSERSTAQTRVSPNLSFTRKIHMLSLHPCEWISPFAKCWWHWAFMRAVSWQHSIPYAYKAGCKRAHEGGGGFLAFSFSLHCASAAAFTCRHWHAVLWPLPGCLNTLWEMDWSKPLTYVDTTGRANTGSPKM